MVRADLIGNEELVTHVAALELGLEEAIRERQRAELAAHEANASDSDALTAWLRGGREGKPPPRTKDKAEKAVEDAKLNAVAALNALQQESRALAEAVSAGASDIKASLAEKEDDLAQQVDHFIEQIEVALTERAAVQAHRSWVDRAEGRLGAIVPRAQREIGDLRIVLREVEKASERDELERRREAWDEIVERATATVPHDLRIPVLDGGTGFTTVPVVDQAIEREVERLEEEGVEVDPTSEKWRKKLGLGKWGRVAGGATA